MGTFLEGDLVLLLGAYLAFVGYFDLPLIMSAAFLGTLLGDQFFFFLGRTRGLNYLLLRRRKLRRKVDKVNKWLSRYRFPLILGLRFNYGFRVVVSFVFGNSYVSIRSFVVLHLISVFIWVLVVGGGGFYFDKGINAFVENSKHLDITFISILLLGILFWRFIWMNRVNIWGFGKLTNLRNNILKKLKDNSTPKSGVLFNK